MPKRRRLFTPIKNRLKPNSRDSDVKEVSTARGRLKGALMDVLEPAAEDSDSSYEEAPYKEDIPEQDSDEEDRLKLRRRSLQQQSYVLKLFDRSVDLSQFNESSPLYPICRAWIANQPKANYKDFGKTHTERETYSDSIDLPGPEGPPVSKIPPLLPEQLNANKNNINLNYREAPPPSREQLLASHCVRWVGVRQAWLEQASKAEARYDGTQQILNKINVNAI